MTEDQPHFCLKYGIYATSELLNGKIIVVLQSEIEVPEQQEYDHYYRLRGPERFDS